MTEGVRIQKLLSQAGIASRRKGEQLIVDGRVKVNGKVVTTLGVRVDPIHDQVEVDGERIELRDDVVVLALNKPEGIVTTTDDEYGRSAVLELLPDEPGVRPVGRLDKDTTGLLLLTNDGDLAFRLTHPRYQVPRTYLAEVRGVPSGGILARLRKGIVLEDGVARATAARVIDEAPGRSLVELTITEGRNREVRRMLEEVGFPVVHLSRVTYGSIRLGDLPVGRHRYLSPVEIGTLRRDVGL